MNTGLKGVTKNSTLQDLKALEFSFFSFDLRPKSFNFTQKDNIISLVQNLEASISVNLMFENEKDYVVTELYESVKSNMFNSSICFAEFAGTTPLVELEKLGIPYVWHYHDKEALRNIKETGYLKKIILHHSDLEYLSGQGELFGYLQLLSDAVEQTDINFELQVDWNTSLLESMFSFFNFSEISFEITNLVEESYQNPNSLKIEEQVIYYTNLLTTEDGL